MAEVNSPQFGNRPVSLWDVDGVFLVLALEQPPGFQPHKTDQYTFYNPQHAHWIAPILGVTDGCWMTAHRANAHADIGVDLGLEEMDWINDIRDRDGVRHPKQFSSVQAYFSDRPIAWVSDDHFPEHHAWAARRTECEAPTLLVDVATDHGLQQEHVQAVVKWLGQFGIDTF